MDWLSFHGTAQATALAGLAAAVALLLADRVALLALGAEREPPDWPQFVARPPGRVRGPALEDVEDLDALFLPPRSPNVERWTGPKFGPGEEAAEALGFGEVLCTAPTEIVLDEMGRMHRDGRKLKLFLASTSEVYGKTVAHSWGHRLPDPDSPVTTTSWCLGMVTSSTPCRLLALILSGSAVSGRLKRR